MAATTSRAELRAERRAERRATRTAERQAARQSTGGGLFSGIGARMAQRQTAKQTRRQTRLEGRQGLRSERISGRTERATQRQTGRTGRITAKAEGGAFTPESVAARWAGITGVTEAGIEGLGSVAMLASGGSPASGALAALQGLIPSDEATDGELIELYPAEDTGGGFLLPLIIGGAALAAYLLFAPQKGKKGKKKK